MARCIFDCETDGFLESLTTIHCLVLKDVDTGTALSCSSSPGAEYCCSIAHGLETLMSADEIIGHNVIKFDIPALKKVYPWFDIDPAKVTDTLVLAKLYKGNVKDEDIEANARDDARRNSGLEPVRKRKLFGQQGLEAWGCRLSDYKGDYADAMESRARDLGITDKEELSRFVWGSWNAEMQFYCEQDVEVTLKLYNYLRRFGPWPKAERLEHDAAWLCARIERNGLRFNVDKAVALYGELAEKREVLANELKSLFSPWVVSQGEKVPKVSNKKTCLTKGAPFTKIKLVEFNPRSRDHIANRLAAKYGWIPSQFTEKGKPQIDEQVLHGLDYPEAKALAELFLIQKRIDQLAEGDEAWLKNEKDGWVNYNINPNGAVTGRATHSRFNITQVPKVGSRYGKECRELFEALPGWVLLGVDASSLELRCLSHFMSKWDGGAYGKSVVEGREEDGTDVHSVNTKALGMEPQTVYTINGKQQKGRNCGKTFIYAFLYGAGNEKIGKTLGTNKACGGKIKQTFLERLPALGSLIKAVKAAAKRGYLIGLDGRHLHVRSEHAALNTLLQSAGALVCKHWMVTVERLLLAQGLKHGWGSGASSSGDFAIMIWAHDELQIAVRPGLDPAVVGSAAKEAMKMTEEFFKFQVPLCCEWKTGSNWAETH